MEKKASFVGRLLSENQMSEAFINSMFLALSGGFQDAYTYNCRDEVFSNAQTGNVVLMSQNFLEGNFTAGLRYLFPILFFAMGVFLAENFQEHYRYAKRLHWRQVLLAAEIVILAIVGFIPSSYNMLAAMLVCVRDSGTDLPQGRRLFVCKHHVHRKPAKRNRSAVHVSAG